MPNVQVLEDEIENMKRQFTALKGELMTVGNTSSKSLKRESIAHNLSSNSLRRDSNLKGRASVASNIGDQVNKENMGNEEGRRESLLQGIDANAVKIDGDFDKEIEGLHVEVNTLNLFYD